MRDLVQNKFNSCAEEICGYIVRSTSTAPFRVVSTGVKGEADIVLDDGAQLDRTQTPLYQFDLIPYTCSSGKHLGRFVV